MESGDENFVANVSKLFDGDHGDGRRNSKTNASKEKRRKKKPARQTEPRSRAEESGPGS
jgi:hypothetical protein